jgi:hypothetical protein
VRRVVRDGRTEEAGFHCIATHSHVHTMQGMGKAGGGGGERERERKRKGGGGKARQYSLRLHRTPAAAACTPFMPPIAAGADIDRAARKHTPGTTQLLPNVAPAPVHLHNTLPSKLIAEFVVRSKGAYGLLDTVPKLLLYSLMEGGSRRDDRGGDEGSPPKRPRLEAAACTSPDDRNVPTKPFTPAARPTPNVGRIPQGKGTAKGTAPSGQMDIRKWTTSIKKVAEVSSTDFSPAFFIV